MIKRLFISILVVVLVLATSVTAFATNTEEAFEPEGNYKGGKTILRFAAVTSAKVVISFDGNKARVVVDIKPKPSASLDYVNVSAKLMKVGSNKAIKSWTQNVEAGTGGYLTFSEKTSLSASGKYYVKATVKCYKNNKVVDTLKIESEQLQYD